MLADHPPRKRRGSGGTAASLCVVLLGLFPALLSCSPRVEGPEREQVIRSTRTFIDLLIDGQTLSAYQMMAPEYRSRHDVQGFAAQWGTRSGRDLRSYTPGEGTIVERAGPQRVRLVVWGRNDAMTRGPVVYLRRHEDRWLLTGDEEWFSD